MNPCHGRGMSKEGEEDLYDAFLTEEQFQKESSLSQPKVSKIVASSTGTVGCFCLQVSGLPWWVSDRDLKQRLGMSLMPVDWLFQEHPLTGKSLGRVILQWEQQEKLDAALPLLNQWQPEEGCTLEVKSVGPLKEYRQRVLKAQPWEVAEVKKEDKRVESRDVSRGDVGRGDRDHRGDRDSRDVGRDVGREFRDGRDLRCDLREFREHREARDHREHRDNRDYRDGRDYRDNRETREYRDNRETRDHREARDVRDRHDTNTRDYDRLSRSSRNSKDDDVRTRSPPRHRARSPISAQPPPPVPRTGANQIPIGSSSTEFQVNIGDRIVRRKR